jgi:hypothetical protein
MVAYAQRGRLMLISLNLPYNGEPSGYGRLRAGPDSGHGKPGCALKMALGMTRPKV